MLFIKGLGHQMNILFGLHSKIISVFPVNEQMVFNVLDCLVKEKNTVFTHSVCSYFSASFSHPSYSLAVHSYCYPCFTGFFTYSITSPPFITHTPYALPFNAVHSNWYYSLILLFSSPLALHVRLSPSLLYCIAVHSPPFFPSISQLPSQP